MKLGVSCRHVFAVIVGAHEFVSIMPNALPIKPCILPRWFFLWDPAL